VDDEDDLERGDEIPYAPWWGTDEGLARMRELEGEVDELDNELNELDNELNRRRPCRK
jgi:hypothetical protein